MDSFDRRDLRRLTRGDKINDCTIVRFLGDGQSGEVYVVRMRGHRDQLALKMHRGPLVTVSRRDFERERQIVEEQPIPGRMPAFVAKGTWHDKPYFVMQLGKALPRWLPRRKMIPLVAEVAVSLKLLAEADYIHCDVKPTNLCLIDGKVCLLDFGSAVRLSYARKHRLRAGTRTFMSYEVDSAGLLSPLADLHSLAMTLLWFCPSYARTVFTDVIVRSIDSSNPDRFLSFDAFRTALLACEDDFRRKVALATRRHALKVTALTILAAVALYAVCDFGLFTYGRLDATQRVSSSIHASSIAQLGIQASLSNDWDRAFFYLTRAESCEGYENGRVLGLLAYCHFRGKGTTVDLSKAKDFAIRAKRLHDDLGMDVLLDLEDCERQLKQRTSHKPANNNNRSELR